MNGIRWRIWWAPVGFVALAFAAGCSEEGRTSLLGPEGAPLLSEGTGEVGTMSVPAHDDFDNAVVIGSLPFFHTTDTDEATTAFDDPWCFGQGPTVWYAFTPTEDGWVEANTFGSGYDTTLGAYVGERGDLIELACNDDAEDDGFWTLQSRVLIPVQTGVTVYFMVGAWASGPGGYLEFRVLPAAPPPPPPPPLVVGLTLDPVGTFDSQTGLGMVRGTVSCSRHTFVDLFGTLEGRIRRADVHGWLWGWTECDGTAEWEAEVHVPNVYLTGGSYQVHVQAGFWDPAFGDFAWAEQSGTVSLRGGRSSGARGGGGPSQDHGGAMVSNSGAGKDEVQCFFRGSTTTRGTLVRSPQGYATLSCFFDGLDPVPQTEVLTGWRCGLNTGEVTVQSRWVRNRSGRARLVCQFNDKPEHDAVVDFGQGARPAQQGPVSQVLDDLPAGRLSGEVVFLGLACAGLPLFEDPGGRIALIERGACPFTEKLTRALEAGAAGVIVFNHVEGGDALIAMAGDPVPVPAVFVGHSTGMELLSLAPVEAAMMTCRSSGTCRGAL